jgi:hypothetical protein
MIYLERGRKIGHRIRIRRRWRKRGRRGEGKATIL